MEAEKKEEKGNSGAPSASSSPSHEFSFTISLHSSTSTATSKTSVTTPEKIKQQDISPLAIDLTPADEIFFHGHLLPLHFLSHLHAAGAGSSPRHSTNSMDSFTLPIRDMLHEQETNSIDLKPTPVDNDDDDNEDDHTKIGNFELKGRKPFSLFKWRKGSESKERESNQQQQDQKRKVKFDVSQFVKRYVKMVKPLLSPKGGGAGRRDSGEFRRHTYSFSGAVSPRDRRDIRGRRGELFSAPASMRTSPTNSGLLLATSGVPSPSSDSTMEELQAAIQAAIAHCKNSIGAGDQKKSSGAISVPVT